MLNQRFNGSDFPVARVQLSRAEFAALCSEHDQAVLDLAARVFELSSDKPAFPKGREIHDPGVSMWLAMKKMLRL